MGYMIRYGHVEKKGNAAEKKSPGWVVDCLAGAALAIGIFWPEAAEMLRAVLFPWLDEQTVMAFQNMIELIGAGSPVKEALLAFCREIISNAGILV